MCVYVDAHERCVIILGFLYVQSTFLKLAGPQLVQVSGYYILLWARKHLSKFCVNFVYTKIYVLRLYMDSKWED